MDTAATPVWQSGEACARLKCFSMHKIREITKETRYTEIQKYVHSFIILSY